MTSINLNNREAWQENAKLWETYKPPIRPSAGELLLYDLALSSQSDTPFTKKALLLGDCPELRDLLAEYRYVTYVVANDPNAVIAMNQLLEFKGEKKEKIIITNWQDMDFEEGSFDIVLSDWGLNSLTHWLDYTLVFERVSTLLKPGGIFMTRLNVYQSEKNAREVTEIMLDFDKNKKDKFSYLLELEMYSDISNYDRQSFQINLGEFYRDKVTQAYHDKKMSFADWQEFYYPFFTVILTYPDKQAVEELLEKFFFITAERYGADYAFSKNEPIYICQKR